MNKYFIVLLALTVLLACNDKHEAFKKEVIIKKGTVFLINEKQEPFDYISVDSIIIKKDTSLYGYECKESDLIFKIPLFLKTGAFTIGDFYIFNINDTIYIKEPLYAIYSNTTIYQGKTTLITFNDTGAIFNSPLKDLEHYKNIFISILGEIEIK